MVKIEMRDGVLTLIPSAEDVPIVERWAKKHESPDISFRAFFELLQGCSEKVKP